MKGRVFWLVTSYLMVLSLVLAACAPKAPTEVTPAAPKATVPTTPKEATPTAPTAPKETVAPTTEVPKYGGTVVIPAEVDIMGWDGVYLPSRSIAISQSISYEFLLQGDWSRGPAGTNETTFMEGELMTGFFDHTGAIAESWELPDDQTMIFKIRKGVYFHDKPPVNGREVDAEDIAYSIRYVYLNPKVPDSYNVVASAPAGQKLLSAEATDKWTAVVKVTGMASRFFEDVAMSKQTHIVPREVIEKYGDLKDWHNSLGTGPFMLTDYVRGSSVTFVKNPNYWQKDPVGPGKGNQLPYLDGVKVLMMTDKSTVFSAFRTGKVDVVYDAGIAPDPDELQGLLKSNPATKSAIQYGQGNHIGTRMSSTDPRAAPMVKSRRVRQALAMAIDNDAMVRDLYGGAAQKRSLFFDENHPLYINDDRVVEILQTVFGLPPEEAQIVKKMYGYYPEEAKKILAEEGYPNGFSTIATIMPVEVDEASVIKGYWEKIGVKLELDVKQTAVWRSYVDTHVQPAMIMSGTLRAGGPAAFIGFGPGDDNPAVPRYVSNRHEINDPTLNKWMQKVAAVYSDYEARAPLLQQAEAWIIYNAWATYLPSPNDYHIWQPWLKNYYGMSTLGFKGTARWTYYAWLDQALKKQLGFK